MGELEGTEGMYRRGRSQAEKLHVNEVDDIIMTSYNYDCRGTYSVVVR